jgi:DNA polymerase-3 subunit epsilon/oligoribonuclease
MQAIFLDIETTGLDAMQHRAIDVAFKVVNLTTGYYEGSYQSLISISPEAWRQSDPASMKINGYTWEQVAQGKAPTEVRQEIITLLTELKIERGKAVFICQNPSFDRGFFMQLVDVYTQERLHWPYHWLDFASMYWALLTAQAVNSGTPFPLSLNLSKNEIAKTFNLPEEAVPHRAMQGVEHLIRCYQAVFGVIFNRDSKPC